MTKNKSITLMSSTAVLLWLPVFISRANGQIAMTVMLAAIAACIGVLWKGFENRKRSFLLSGTTVLAVAWISIATWKILLRYYPLREHGIDPFAGSIALWAILTFVLGLVIFAAGFWALVRRQRSYRVLGFATGATLIFTSNYFFQLIAGV